ncbi:MAG TPA: hypothetical protein VKY90_03860, partial [Candidatus Dormibacteraeota bacterium]|nr:hypothetical protein [Candidatus Dormibacteraeota bacterium]
MGRRSRARLHAGWSPRTRQRTRKVLLRVGAVLLLLLIVGGIGINAYAISFLRSLPPVTGLDATLLKGDTLIYDR